MPHAPASFDVPANGLPYRVLEWPASPPGRRNGRESAPPAATVLLLHGYMDAAATWDLIAPDLAAAGLRVIAPDLRGFGDAPRTPSGSYYHFPYYVFDVADVVDALVPPGSPLCLVGHSMGGSVATLYAGTFPERVERLVLLEGAGPPDNPFDVAPHRMRRWIDEVRQVRMRGERVLGSHEDALRRLVGNHPSVPEDVLRTRVDQLARARPDGRFAWKADALHATASPMPFFAESWKAFARRVTCPVLFVSGGPLGWHPPDEDERVACFAALERAEIAGAGHMMHWTAPRDLSLLLVQFLDSLTKGPPGV